MAADVVELKDELAGIVAKLANLRSQISILEDQKAAFEKVIQFYDPEFRSPSSTVMLFAGEEVDRIVGDRHFYLFWSGLDLLFTEDAGDGSTKESLFGSDCSHGDILLKRAFRNHVR